MYLGKYSDALWAYWALRELCNGLTGWRIVGLTSIRIILAVKFSCLKMHATVCLGNT